MSVSTVSWAALMGIALAPLSGAQEAGPSVTTTVRPDPFPNAAPRALDRQAVVEADAPRRTPSVLLGVYDVENDPIKVSSSTRPAHGTAALNEDGTFTYTPSPGYAGPDEFKFTLSDGRGGSSTATMRITVVRPSAKGPSVNFTGLDLVAGEGGPIRHGKGTTVPRAADWDGDGKIDLLVGAAGEVWMYRNTGTRTGPRFAAGVRVRAGGKEIRLAEGRVSVSWVDLDGDGRKDLVVVSGQDRKVRFFRNQAGGAGEPALANEVVLKARGGEDFVGPDVRAEVADWNGDGRPDVLFGAHSGRIVVALNAGPASAPALEAPAPLLDGEGREIGGSYNLNVRVADVDQDGLPDLIDTYNWGTLHFRLNVGSAAQPRLRDPGTIGVTGPGFAAVNLHQATDGPIVDFADFNGDGTTDLVMGGEAGGAVRMAWGRSGATELEEIRAILAAHPQDLGPFLADPANAGVADRLRSHLGALYDFATGLATPSQKDAIGRGLIDLIQKHPQYFALQPFDIKRNPGLPSLAVQVWLTRLVVDYHDPAGRKALADAARFTGGYRTLVEQDGLVYADNNQNPRGAEAIHDWLRTIPREVYPGTCITANDWLGGRGFLVRGHTKNTFNGGVIDGGEYGFGRDARAVIGDRGSENWFMTVVRHEACHDLDAYVRRSPELTRRWGQTLVLAGGPDMRADPATGWLSMDLTRKHFAEAGLWNGDPSQWDAAWKKYWAAPPGSDWKQYGFMRGNIEWFYGAPQESLATQGNQHWNSTEGRIEVAIDRWNRGFRSNLTEVLFFLDLWSVGMDKVKFYEVDNACNQTISFARLGRTPRGYIRSIDLGERRYEFAVDEKGVVTALARVPEKRPGPGR